ncbi:HAD family phosphatase [Gammaproteobacteria bacterium]|nr:HAD family phosphatase [Gammaproteobacteria bacterium]
MDGTLLDTETIARELFVLGCSELGCECKIEVYEETIGLNFRQAHLIFLDRAGPEYPYSEIRKLTSKWFSDRINEGPLPTKEGASLLLETLAGLDIDIGLCTSTGRKTVDRCLDYLGFHHYFKEMVCGGESDEGKPHPAPYLNIANKMSLDPSASWAIEDSPNGVRSAGSAGYLVLHVPDQNSPSKDMSDLVWAVYSSLMEITRDINDLESNSSI